MNKLDVASKEILRYSDKQYFVSTCTLHFFEGNTQGLVGSV